MGLNLKMKKLAGGDSEPLIHKHTHTSISWAQCADLVQTEFWK